MTPERLTPLALATLLALAACLTVSPPPTEALGLSSDLQSTVVVRGGAPFLRTGANCDFQLIALDPGLCRLRVNEYDLENGYRVEGKNFFEFRTLKCGASAEACGQRVECDCARAVAFDPCNLRLGRAGKDWWDEPDGRVSSEEWDSRRLRRMKRQCGEPYPRALSVAELADAGEDACSWGINAPKYGECMLWGSDLFETDEGPRPDGGRRKSIGIADKRGTIPFGETRLVCGIPLHCGCELQWPMVLQKCEDAGT